MEITAIGATTHRDRSGDKLTKEDLEDLASRFSIDGAAKFTEEHDITLPPLGQWREAHVEPTEDGEYKLVMIGEIFEKEERITLPDGTDAIKRESKTVNRPFSALSPYQELQSPEPAIFYDRNNFTSRAAFNRFLHEIEESSNIEFLTGETVRKAWAPDPQLIITIGSGIWAAINGTLLLQKSGAKLTDAISNDVLEFYNLVKAAALGMIKYAVPENRPITYLLTAPSTPSIQFVARTKDVEGLIAALHPECIQRAIDTLELYQSTLDIKEAQFLLNNKGEWSWNYLLTAQGQTIGRKKSFRRKVTEIDLNLFQGKGTSVSLIGKHPIDLRQSRKNTRNGGKNP